MALGHQLRGVGHTDGPHDAPRTAEGGIAPGDFDRRALTTPTVEYERFRDTAVADAAGVATLVVQIAQNRIALIDRISVTSTSAAASVVNVYEGDVDDANLVDYTAAGNRAVADELQPIVVPGNSLLTIRWTAATPGAICRTRVQYRTMSPRS